MENARDEMGRSWKQIGGQKTHGEQVEMFVKRREYLEKGTEDEDV